MSGPTEVVIAGTKPFALALFAPVTERAGARPRIAPEPAMALTLCIQSTGVLVVEYEPRWLPTLTKLRLERPSLRVVAALPRGQEGAALSLGPLSIDAVPWDGQALSVMPAIERAIGAGRPGAAAPPAAEPHAAPHHASPVAVLLGSGTLPHPAPPGQARPAPAATPPPAESTLDLFHDLGAGAATPVPSSLGAVSAFPLPSRPGAAWPANGPSAAEAEVALRAFLSGAADASPLRPVTEATVAGLSSLERDVLSGAVPADAELIRHAAVLRLRAAAAMATRPVPGTAIDSAAVAELLSEIDGVLHQVKALLDDATPEVKPQLEAIRNALVREAVDFSEACHEIGTAELPLAPAAARPTGRAAAARVISSHVGLDAADRPEERRRKVAPLVVLALVLAAAAGYHLWNLTQAPPPQQAATFEGAPAGTRALVTPGGHFLVLQAGKTMDSAALERFRAQEQRKGNVVREIGSGRWIIEPANTGAGAHP